MNGSGPTRWAVVIVAFGAGALIFAFLINAEERRLSPAQGRSESNTP